MTDLVIGEIIRERKGNVCRIVAKFDGEPVWFETEDVDLEPSVEAFATLWLMPCLLAKRNLRFEKPVCKTWYENANKFIDFLSDHWGKEKIEIFADTYDQQIEAKEAVAVCFSGGVDSMYTLMKGGSPRYLLSAEPFDLPSSFTETFKVARRRLETVAAAVGSTPVSIRTNVTEHPSFKTHRLLDTNTGILASMGHLLAPHIGSISISSSHRTDEPDIHVCFQFTDPLLSSQNLHVVHAHTEVSRREKVAQIADWPIAQENLAVCFNKQGENRNCGRCEKCVRTMLDLCIAGKLESIKSFDLSRPLWEAMDHVKLVTYLETYQKALYEPLDPRIRSGIWRMLRREYERICRLEDAALHRRHVDEEFANMKDGLENALHHYSLLQKNYDNLLKDYKELAENRPLRRGVRAVRHVIRMLRAGRQATPRQSP